MSTDIPLQKSLQILLIGETCTDIFIYGSVSRLCPEAPAPVFNPSKKNENMGMAGNVSNNLSALGLGHEFVTNSNYAQIKKIRYVDERTNTVFIRVDENDDKIQQCNIEGIDFMQYDAVIVSDYNKGFLTKMNIQSIIEKSQRVFLDTKKTLGPWCSDAFIIKINSVEYERTKHTLTKAMGAKLICTKGHNGCVYKETVYPVPGVLIKDVSGAGDTFLAGLVYSYMHNCDMDKAIKFANACSTIAVQSRGVTTIALKHITEKKDEN